MKFFASDNNSGAHPRVMEAMAKANQGGAQAYGGDDWTALADEVTARHFGPEARGWFVFLGTAANVLGLKALVRSHEAVICGETAHLHIDECGAPESIIGSKLLLVPSPDGKVCLKACKALLPLRESEHHVYPRALSITQSTECGTVYSLEELEAVGRFCREHNLYLHMDGARICNAAAALDATPAEIVRRAGVDVLSFGGTKNGLMFGEMVVVLNPSLGREFAYLRKQNMQLLSKMRFLAAQFVEYLGTDLWLENARTANRMAGLLASAVSGMDHVRLAHPVQVNAVFARLHKNVIARLHERKFYFYVLDPNDAEGYPKDWHLVRLMTSFNTTEAEVMELAQALKECA